jgi:HK97 family phage portal protein
MAFDGLINIFVPRSISANNPMNPLSDPDTWLDSLGGGPTDAGITVSAESALTYSPIWRGINLIAGDFSRLPLFVYKRVGEGKKRDPRHPAYYMLRRKPNPETVDGVFKSTIEAHALLHGNGFAYIVRRGNGTPTEMWILPPVSTYLVRVDGAKWVVTTIDAEQHKIPYKDIFHIPGLSYDGVSGISLIEKAKQSIGLGLGMQKYGATFFGNAARASVVLEHPQSISEGAAERLKNSWDKMTKGLKNAHRTVVLEEGMSAKHMSINAKDAQLIESRQFETREVANWLGVPPHKLGDPTRTSYNSLEQEAQAYLDGLDPRLVAYENECWDKLLTEQEKRDDTHLVEFERKALLRADLAARAAYYSKALGGVPWTLVDEVRGIENLPPLPNGEGAVFRIPLNMGEAGEEEPEPEPVAPPSIPPEPEDDEDDEERARVRTAHEALLAERVGYSLRQLGHHADKAAQSPGTFCHWLDDGLEMKYRATMVKTLRPAVAVCVAAGGGSDMAVASAATGAILGGVRASLNHVAETVAANELQSAVVAAREKWIEDLPGQVAGIVWS